LYIIWVIYKINSTRRKLLFYGVILRSIVKLRQLEKCSVI
jgi:hypothetical protein